MTDAYLTGLSNFQIKHFDLRILRTSLSFNIFYDQLVIEGQHSTHGKIAGLAVSGTGPINMVLNEVNVNGTIQMNTINGGYLNLETLHFGITIQSADAHLKGFGVLLDETVSLLISNALPTLVNESQAAINEIISSVLQPGINAELNQIKPLDIILSIIQAILPGSLSQENEVVV